MEGAYMTRLRELLSDKPLLAAYVAVAVTAMATGTLAFDKIDKVARMMDGELVTVTQAVKMDARANDAVQEMTRFVVGLKNAGQIEDAVAFREKVQDVSHDLHSVHYPKTEGKSGRAADPLAVYADKLQNKGIQLQNAIWMLKTWEASVANGRPADAEQQRDKVIDILMKVDGAHAAGLASESFKWQAVAFSPNP
jgi:hypothetical protein